MMIIPMDARAVNPVLSNYGVLPVYGDVNPGFLFWVTYADADNDTPTYVRIVRYVGPAAYDYKDMVANDSSTNYTTGKQYSYQWWFMPFVGTTMFRFTTVSNASTVVFKTITATQTIPATLSKHGIAPEPDLVGNYSFYITYQSRWNYPPTYVRLWLDGTLHSMIKNNSSDTDYWTGVAYHYSTNLTTGLHNYSFHATESLGFCPDRTSDNFTARISSDNMTISLSPDMSALILGIVFGFGLIILSVIDKGHPIWPTFAGLAWFMIAIVAFYPVGVGWMFLGIGIGLIMWVEGAMGYASGREKK
jgi:hypothetical protein